MNDNELLRWAARATGSGVEMSDYSDRTPDHWIAEYKPRCWKEWNPLEDDGDALRLAVKLRLDIARLSHFEVEASDFDGSTSALVTGAERDPFAATRRAIVEAAAKMGKQANAALSGCPQGHSK